jgi:hypothetical protein
MSCKDICCCCILYLIVVYFVGFSTLVGFGYAIVSGAFGFLFLGIVWAFAVLIYFCCQFPMILYYVWCAIILIINVVALFVMLTEAFRHQNNLKNQYYFFTCIIAYVCLPQLINWILINHEIRVYLLLPFHLAIFFGALNKSIVDNMQMTGKILKNYVFFSCATCLLL